MLSISFDQVSSECNFHILFRVCLFSAWREISDRYSESMLRVHKDPTHNGQENVVRQFTIRNKTVHTIIFTVEHVSTPMRPRLNSLQRIEIYTFPVDILRRIKLSRLANEKKIAIDRVPHYPQYANPGARKIMHEVISSHNENRCNRADRVLMDPHQEVL